MVKIYVNHYGWICGGSYKTSLKFTKYKAGAKTFEDGSKELLETRIYIERTMKCNYDVIR